MTLDEAIAREREMAEMHRNDIVPKEDYHNMPWIDKENELNMISAEEHEQCAEWLEELKAYKSLSPMELVSEKQKNDRVIEYNKGFDYGFKTGYNKAIDDFVRFANTMPTVESEDGTIRPMWLEEIAEQLKVGGENEQSI